LAFEVFRHADASFILQESRFGAGQARNAIFTSCTNTHAFLTVVIIICYHLVVAILTLTLIVQEKVIFFFKTIYAFSRQIFTRFAPLMTI